MGFYLDVPFLTSSLKMDRRRRRDGPAPALVQDALRASRAYEAELRGLADALAADEAALVARIRSLRRRRALKRAELAANKLLAPSASRGATATAAAGDAVFEREVESAYKKVGVVPRSFIRAKRSFFYDDEAAEAAKRRRLWPGSGGPDGGEQLAGLAEPTPNQDTLSLRLHSHEAFLATPSRVFSAKERELVRRFAAEHSGVVGASDALVRLPLDVWRHIASQRPAVLRPPFACKLWWELHEDPRLRLCAWTKQEDERLRQLATGVVDPAIVNDWEEIARRMPVAGRPPVHCLIRFQTKLCASNVHSSFSPDEDALIRRAVAVFGEKWNVVADLMDGRVPEQIRHRWQLSLAPNIRQGKFSIIEDRRLLLAIAAYQNKAEAFQKDRVAWNDVAHHVPGRTQPAMRDRFLNSLNPELTFAAWSAREDELIRSRVQDLGLDRAGIWATIAGELGNRSDNQVMRRWKYLEPTEYDRYKADKQRNQTLTAVFRRPTLGRRSASSKAVNQKRSTYNAKDSEQDAEEPELEDADTAESSDHGDETSTAPSPPKWNENAAEEATQEETVL